MGDWGYMKVEKGRTEVKPVHGIDKMWVLFCSQWLQQFTPLLRSLPSEHFALWCHLWWYACDGVSGTWLGVENLFSRARLWPSTPRWKLFLLMLSSDSDLDNLSSSPFSSPMESFFWLFFFLLSLALLELILDVSEELSERPIIRLLSMLVYSAAAIAIACCTKRLHTQWVISKVWETLLWGTCLLQIQLHCSCNHVPCKGSNVVFFALWIESLQNICLLLLLHCNKAILCLGIKLLHTITI